MSTDMTPDRLEEIADYLEGKFRPTGFITKGDMAAYLRAQAERMRGDCTVTCEECGFRYGAEHTNGDGTTYTCPLCEAAALAARVERYEKARTTAINALVVRWPSGVDTVQDEAEHLLSAALTAFKALTFYGGEE